MRRSCLKVENATVYYTNNGWSWNKLGRVDISGFKRCHQCGNWTGERLKTAVGLVSCLLSGEFPFRNLCIQGDATSFFLHSNWANDFEIFQEFLNANVLEILFFFVCFFCIFKPMWRTHTLRTQMCGSSAQLGMTQCCIIREAETPGPGWLFRIWGESRVKVLVSY